MHLRASLTKFWAYSSMLLVTGIILFLFGYVFYRGAGTISWEFLSQPPRGAVLGEEGFITNAGDVALVATDAACEAAAQAYYECILTYFDLT